MIFLMSKKFPFVKGGVFDKLDHYLKSKPLMVKNRSLTYPIQDTFPGFDFDYSYGMRSRLGLFFEILSGGIYGGDSKEQQEIEIENGSKGLLKLISEPDIVHLNENIFREVKAFSQENALKLFDGQMEKYAQLQLHDFEIPPTIRFELFRHGLIKLIKNYKTSDLDSLILDLSQNVGFMISLPFSAAYTIYDNASVPNTFGEKKWPFTSRYEGEAYTWCTQFRPPGINSLLASPGDTFEKLGLDPEDFKFTFRKFPNDVKINGHVISPFPILLVEEKDPYTQLFNLKKRVEERNGRITDDHPEYSPLFNGEVEAEDVEGVLEDDTREFIPGWDF
jgi:hypothetical protein